MTSRKILGTAAAILIFLGVVLLFSILINSSNLIIRILSWLLGSMIAFSVYKWILGED